jgi:hypothetical protein
LKIRSRHADEKSKRPSTAELRLFFVVGPHPDVPPGTWSFGRLERFYPTLQNRLNLKRRMSSPLHLVRGMSSPARLSDSSCFTAVSEARSETAVVSHHPTRARRGLQPFTMRVKRLEKSQ